MTLENEDNPVEYLKIWHNVNASIIFKVYMQFFSWEYPSPLRHSHIVFFFFAHADMSKGCFKTSELKSKVSQFKSP